LQTASAAWWRGCTLLESSPPANSAHDLRHAFAVGLCQATHDLYQVEKALGHANVAITEGYLRSLGLVGGV